MANTLSMSAASTQYVFVPVISSGDLTGGAVAMAFLADQRADPVTGDWQTATWDVSTGQQAAKLLVGPGAGGYSLAAGTYNIWVKVTATPEIPVLLAGTITLS